MFRTYQEKLSIKTALQFINEHKQNLNRYKRLGDYYNGKHDIIYRQKEFGKPNYKVVNNYAKYITDMLTGYFMGLEVKYSSLTEEVEDLVDELIKIFNINTEKRENFKLAKTCSIKGECFEVLYVNADGNIKFRKIEPESCFLVFDNTIENKLLHAVRYYSDELIDENGVKKKIDYIEIYDSEEVRYYESTDADYKLIDRYYHSFEEVPIIHFVNNEERSGDFEHSISNIDAYNLAQSNTLNDMEDFSDAYLVLTNMLSTNNEDINKAKADKVFLLDEEGKAEWLIKQVNDVWVENMKKRINDDIHKFSFTPDMSDENFGSNVSGVSLRYKLLAMEQLRKTKEGYFEQALKRRIRLITNVLTKKYNVNKEFSFKDIEIKFNNSLPQNELELAQIIQILTPLLSEETLISKLPDIADPLSEIEKKKREEEEDINNSFKMYRDLGANDERQQSEVTEE